VVSLEGAAFTPRPHLFEDHHQADLSRTTRLLKKL